jgi:hypothetical protein
MIEKKAPYYMKVGGWSGGIFVPAACGNITITHCPGTLNYTRG